MEAMPAGRADHGFRPDRCRTGGRYRSPLHDTGSGIPPELMERICEPFFSTHQEEGMRGLGLAIVQDIVKMHGGRIAIESRSHEGTKIVLTFPAAEELRAG